MKSLILKFDPVLHIYLSNTQNPDYSLQNLLVFLDREYRPEFQAHWQSLFDDSVVEIIAASAVYIEKTEVGILIYNAGSTIDDAEPYFIEYAQIQPIADAWYRIAADKHSEIIVRDCDGQISFIPAVGA